MNLLVIGSGGHAGVVIDAIHLQGKYRICGLLDDFLVPGETRHGYPILGRTDALWSLAAEFERVFVAVGDNYARATIVATLATLAPTFPMYATIVHPSAVVCAASIGWGTFFAAGAVVNAGSVIGNHCIVNTNASLDHDSRLDDFSHLAPNSATGGHVTIGRRVLIGIGASIRDHTCVGDDAIVGLGSASVADVQGGTLTYGNPARVAVTPPRVAEGGLGGA